jgi:hypothetical protein
MNEGSQNILPIHIHRKRGKLYYNIAAPALNQDLDLDANGVPDLTQNPDFIYIGATDAGYDFTAEPTFYEENVDEEDSPIEVGVESVAAQIAFSALEVLDIEHKADMIPWGTYSTNTVGGVTTKRITAGGDRIILPAMPMAVVSPTKDGGWVGVIIYAGYNSGSHTLQFKKSERSKQDMVIKALNVPTRTDGDKLYREFNIPPPA